MKDLTSINGVAVIAREKATMPVPNDPTRSAAIDTVDQVLLADATVIFQCVHKNDPDCAYTAQAVRSVTAHQRSHGDRIIAKQALARATAAETELAERIRRRSEGTKKGNETKAALKAGGGTTRVPAEVGGRGGPKANGNEASSAIGDKELAKMAQNVITAWNALREAEDALQNVLIGYMRAAQTATENPPVIDPQIVAKAKAYDDLKNQMFKA